MTTLILPVETRREILAWSAARAPSEACGFLLGHAPTRDAGAVDLVWTVVDAVECANASLDPRRFEIAPNDVVATDAAARARGLELVGVWHSHPDGEAVPSTRDGADASWVLLVAGLARGRALRAWRRSGTGFVEWQLVAQASCAARIAAHNLRPGNPESDSTP